MVGKLKNSRDIKPISIGIGMSIAERSSHTTGSTGQVSGGVAGQAGADKTTSALEGRWAISCGFVERN